MKELALKLKAARKKLRLSQSKAAAAWGVSTRTLQEWEQDRQTPKKGFILTSLLAMLDGILAEKPLAKKAVRKKR